MKIEKIAISKGIRVLDDGTILGKRGVLKGCLSNNSYLKINIRVEGLSKNVYAHRVQAFQKYGDKIYEKGIVVRHLDGNPLNNSKSNIAIGTYSDNAMDVPKIKRVMRASHPKHPHRDIVNDHKSGMSYNKIMKKYNISSKGTVSFIIRQSLQS